MRFLPVIQLLLAFAVPITLQAEERKFSPQMEEIALQDKYKHATWGLFVKDLTNGNVLFDFNSDKFFLPASTSKLFSVEALLHAYGDDYRFKTPVYATGKVENGTLTGNLVLVAQGDLTLGGRQSSPDTISFTKLDHLYANEIPGVLLTKEDPLHGLNQLAKQISEKGIKVVNGDVVIDDSLFEMTIKRGFMLSPIFVNENLIDIVLNPSAVGSHAEMTWRPMVSGFEVVSNVTTVEKDQPLSIEVVTDENNRIVVNGTLPLGQENIIRNFKVMNSVAFARAAFIDALKREGITVSLSKKENDTQLIPSSYDGMEPVALWTSPPLIEYGQLILKVSHNIGADLIPLLLAAQKGKKSFDEGMKLFGDFVMESVKLPPTDFVFADAAGGGDNRLTPKGEVQLLEYVHRQSPAHFERYMKALPILGVDGSLEDFAKQTPAVGKVFAKPGTGVSFNLAAGRFFLTTQALGGYIQAKDGHLLAYMLVVNNAQMPTIEDIFPIFEDLSQLSNQIYLKE